MTWNQEKKIQKKNKDNFWIGFIPGLILPISIILILIKQNTEKDIWFVLSKLFLILHNTGMQRFMVGILPNLVLLFVFYMIKKEKAISGTFVATIPYIIILFWIF